ncbi:hypothetical protein [Rubrimonas cliftonensis]|uniref:Uncharacterized protein n=1 Tax=Rubrimonas cliftonensis TaxID=89524 RepID=A0A1H3Z4H5_9RHOB|nr:hypothetical protein [Rubrimonas cliftonensis]SEA18699.1 hypothetical protein SAMN05444370_103391 [Rubrimonas cliftonensis]
MAEDGKGDGNEFQDKVDRYGVGYAAFSDALRGSGVDRVVTGVKIVIAVIALYAIGSAVLAAIAG